jgi:hypothetical protein
MTDEIIDIWESRETWLRVASMWRVCRQSASEKSCLPRTVDVMGKICGQIAARCKSGDSTVALSGTRDGWAILTGWLSNVQWRVIVNQHGGQVYNDKERQWAGELGHRLLLGTSICQVFRETEVKK